MHAFIAAADLNVGEATQKGLEGFGSFFPPCWLALDGNCLERNWNADL